MPSRKFHTKRRSGCDTCKRRRVRCGLEQPICANCARLHKICSYTNQARITTQGLDSYPSGSLPVESLQLMHYYSSVTYATMIADVGCIDECEMWQMSIPHHAFTHEFLLHGILALTALHRHHNGDRPTRSLIELARKHQQEALKSYIPGLRYIDKENCHALFAFAVILGPLAYAFLQHAEVQLGGTVFIAGLLDSIELFNGTLVIAHAAGDWLKQGDLTHFIHPDWLEEDNWKVLSAGSIRAIEGLKSLVAQDRHDESSSRCDTPDTRNETYEACVGYLALIFPRACGDQLPLPKVVAWPLLAGGLYRILVRDHDPLALVMLGVYGAAVSESQKKRNVWFMEGWGTRLVNAVQDTLDDTWSKRLEWITSQLSSSN